MSFEIYYQNVQNLQTKCGKVNADLLIFSQTWLDEIQIEGDLRFYRANCKGLNHGGILIAAKRWFRSTQLKVPYFADFEIICVRVEFTFKNVFAICIYVPPDGSFAVYNALVFAIADILTNIGKNDTVLLLGDFNVPIISRKAYISEHFIESLHEMGLYKCDENEQDIVFCSQPDLLQINNCEEDACMYSSDIFHSPLYITINIDGCNLDPYNWLSLKKQKELIELVKVNPLLYDNSNSGYYNHNLRQETWKQIASELGFTVEECRARWGYFRSTFRKRKSVVEKMWFFEDMCFITPYLWNNEDFEESIANPLTVRLSPQTIARNIQEVQARAGVITDMDYLEKSIASPSTFGNTDSSNNDEGVQIPSENEDNLRPFVCKFENCGQRFTTSTSCSRHERIHLGQKDFFCHVCLKEFMRKDSLTRHMRIHKKES